MNTMNCMQRSKVSLGLFLLSQTKNEKASMAVVMLSPELYFWMDKYILMVQQILCKGSMEASLQMCIDLLVYNGLS